MIPRQIVNTPSDYVQVKKYWIDDDNSMNTRPVSVTIKAENKNTHESEDLCSEQR